MKEKQLIAAKHLGNSIESLNQAAVALCESGSYSKQTANEIVEAMELLIRAAKRERLNQSFSNSI